MKEPQALEVTLVTFLPGNRLGPGENLEGREVPVSKFPSALALIYFQPTPVHGSAKG